MSSPPPPQSLQCTQPQKGVASRPAEGGSCARSERSGPALSVALRRSPRTSSPGGTVAQSERCFSPLQFITIPDATPIVSSPDADSAIGCNTIGNLRAIGGTTTLEGRVKCFQANDCEEYHPVRALSQTTFMNRRLRKKKHRQNLESAFSQMTLDDAIQRRLIESADEISIELQPWEGSELARAASAFRLRYVCRVVGRVADDVKRECAWVRVQACEFPEVFGEAFFFGGSLYEAVFADIDRDAGEPCEE